MVVRGREEFLGRDGGLGQYKLWIHTISGSAAAIEITSLVELIFLPTSNAEQ
jgi:hypothetical protein